MEKVWITDSNSSEWRIVKAADRIEVYLQTTSLLEKGFITEEFANLFLDSTLIALEKYRDLKSVDHFLKFLTRIKS